MNILTLDQAKPNPDFGGKINGLLNLIASGFAVPKGFILTSQDIQELVFHKNPDYLTALSKKIDPNKTYIVRSSAYLEDGTDASFAGQYQSVGNCRGSEAIIQAIHTCLQATENSTLEAYLSDRKLANDNLPFALLVQEQVAALHWETIDFSSTRMPMEEISRALCRDGSQNNRSPFRSQSS